MLSLSVSMPNVTSSVFLSVKLEWLHLPCKMKATVMDSQEFLASPSFWSFGEQAVGRRRGLVSKSNTWIKLLVPVNSEYFFLCLWHATFLLVSSSVAVCQWKTVIFLIGVWEVDNLKQRVAVVDSMWLYWFIDLPVSGTCILQLVLPVKAEKIGSTESCRQWWTAYWPVLISAWSYHQGNTVLAKSCIQSGCECPAHLTVCEGPEKIQVSKYKIKIPSQTTSNPSSGFSLTLK